MQLEPRAGGAVPPIAVAAVLSLIPEFMLGGSVLRRVFGAVVGLLLTTWSAHAQDATWLSNPGSNDYNSGANWSAGVVPFGTSSFDTSSITSLVMATSGPARHHGAWIFNPGASAYVISLVGDADAINIFSGAGINVLGGNVTIVNGRKLFFANSSTAGTATISGGYTGFRDNSTGGNARFVSGDVDFSNSTGPNGDGKVSAGSIEGIANVYLGSRELTVGSNNLSTQLTGAVRDGGLCGNTLFRCPAPGGSLVKVGTGTLTLSGSNDYTGPTIVNGGTLIIDGLNRFTSSTTVNAGATLGGRGIVSQTFINGGTLAPGNPGLIVEGSLTFTAASTYLIQVTPDSASRTNVNVGTATLSGATVSAKFAAGSYVAKQYTILSASGGVVGTFGSLTSVNVPATMGASLSYDANNVYLNLDLGVSRLPGLNSNQQNVGNALNNYFNATGGIPFVFTTLTPVGLTQVSGETATGSQQTTFNAMTQFLGTLLDPFIGGRGDAGSPVANATPFSDDAAGAYAASGRKRSGNERDAYAMITKAAPRDPVFEARWSVWAAGFGGSQSTDGNTVAGSNTTTSRVFGGAVGADYRFSPFTIAGFALAGGGTNFNVANGGSGRSDLFQAGAFIKHNAGNAYVSAALAYGWQDITTDRTVTIAGVDRLRAEFNANALSGRVEGGYRFLSPWIGGVGITPYAAGQFTSFDLPAYAEQVVSGAGTFALSYGAKTVTASRSELGLRTDKSFVMPNAVLTLRGRLAWAHDFNADRNAAATFQTLPGASFVVNGAAQGQDSALTTASAEVKWLNGFSLAGVFEGEFSSVTRSYAGKGVARYNW